MCVLSRDAKTKDQNIGRQMYTLSDPGLCPCILPAGKYVVSKKWSFLTGEDWLYGGGGIGGLEGPEED